MKKQKNERTIPVREELLPLINRLLDVMREKLDSAEFVPTVPDLLRLMEHELAAEPADEKRVVEVRWVDMPIPTELAR